MKFMTFMTAFLALAATGATAETNIYKCTILNADGSWIPETLQLSHDIDTGEVLVIDPLINHFNEQKPLSAAVSVENSKRTSYGWTLRSVRNSTGQYASAFSYRATIMKADGKLRISAKPQRYANRFTGSGRCIKSVR